MKKLVFLVAVLLVSFTSAYAQFTFTDIDCPGADLTTARSINNHGQIVGAQRIANMPPRHAVLIKGGQCIPLAPTTVLATNQSEAFKNNDRGDVVGYFNDSNTGLPHGFFLSKDGVLTQLDFPGAGDTEAWGINNSGTVVGFFDDYDPQGNPIATHGFTWDGSNFTQVDYPGSADTIVGGIDARGDLVGGWDNGNNPLHGFIRTKQGEFISFDVPIAGATLTQPNDINAHGEIVGLYIDASGQERGFVQQGLKFTRLRYPHAVTTTTWGINSRGQIVGNHYGSDGLSHGYLAVANKKGAIAQDLPTPPAPAIGVDAGSSLDGSSGLHRFTTK